MKRTLFSLLLTAALLVAAGCGQAGGGASGFAGEDLSLTVDGTPYRCGVDIETVISHLGDGYEYAEGMSCDYDGLDKTYAYETATFYTNPLAEGDMVYEIYTLDPAVTTSKGIAVGATREEVLAAYGEAGEDLGDLLIYSLNGERPSLCFELDSSGAVWAIYLTAQSV